MNFLAGQNVLSIVLELDYSAFFGGETGSLVAVLAETTTNGSFRARLDRVGRPEIKNFILMDKVCDTVNRDLDVRDLYSEEDGFKLRRDYLGAYRARLNASLAFYDGLDGKTDWPLGDQGNHPLTELLLADFLVVDVAKPFAEDGYLEIERAMLRSVPHKTCGGRWLNHDMVDTLLTFLINNYNGPRISDGVEQAPEPASRAFPYLSTESGSAATGRYCRHSPMMQSLSGPPIRTTDGAIAIVNLQAQIESFELRAARGQLTSQSWAELIDLVCLRGQILGCVADYEKATVLAEQRVNNAPADGHALLAQARVRACLHRFDEALIDLDAAEHFGLAGAELEAERAAAFQAVGRYDEAMTLRQAAVEHEPTSSLSGRLLHSTPSEANSPLPSGSLPKAACFFAVFRRLGWPSLSFSSVICGRSTGMISVAPGSGSWPLGSVCRLTRRPRATSPRSNPPWASAMARSPASVGWLQPRTIPTTRRS